MTGPDRDVDRATSTAGALKCSDADREAACAQLHAAMAEGRLTVAETEERLTTAYAARHHHELDALLVDLPAVRATLPTSEPSGWRHVAALARRQLVADAAVLTGHAPGNPSQRIRTLIIALTMLFLLAATIAFLLHGVLIEGHGHGFHGE